MKDKQNKSSSQLKSAKKPTHKNKLGYIDPLVSGIDIGSKLIHVAVASSDGSVFVREFGTTTPDLKRIIELLKKNSVTTGVMEATGVYWVALYEMLEESGLKAVLVDAKSVKNVPGRKTDVLDCQWIQTLYSNGMVRPAFRPKKDRLPLRTYVRHRMNIVKAKQKCLLQMEKYLQLMNVKLSTATSDIDGLTGMNIIRAIVAGNTDPVFLASLRSKRCRQKEQVFIDALTGNYSKDNLFALEQTLERYDFLGKQVKNCDDRILAELEKFPDVATAPPPPREKDKNKRISKVIAPQVTKNKISFDVQDVLWRKSGVDFTALPGLGPTSALTIYAELGGTDVSAWAEVKHFTSWLKLCPGNNISGGKSRKSQSQPCANYISQALRMGAMSSKKSQNYLGAHIRRITGKTDKLKGIKAGAHKSAKLLYFMCKNGWTYFELGEDHYERAHQKQVLKNLQKKADMLGFELVPKAM